MVPMNDGEKKKLAPLATVGVVADTHVPDRVRSLHPELLPGLKAAGVDMILHAGDISGPEVLSALEEIAPVTAVGGNRDIFFLRKLPRVARLVVAGVPIVLMHGHGNFLRYLWTKVNYELTGYRLEQYLSLVHAVASNSRVVVFGHSHIPENIRLSGKLVFNPGSAGIGWRDKVPPSYGILRFYPNSEVVGEIIELKGARIYQRRHQLLDQ